MLTLRTEDILDPELPTGDLLDALLTVRGLIEEPGGDDPLRQIDVAVARLASARALFEKHPLPENHD